MSEFDLSTRESHFMIPVEIFTNLILAKNIFRKSYGVKRA